ncbi:MAG: putative rane protein [Firmicutes bacterium]|nr:putative rane protein [Bacillota bacterium]
MNQSRTSINKTQRISTLDLVMTAMFTAILCVMAQISIPVQPVPFTLSIFALFLIGALLTPRYAFLAAFVYLLLGAFGVPVFAGFKGGLTSLTGMTGGYLMAYPLMTLITALSYKLGKKHKLITMGIGMTLSLILCYLIGTLWFTFLSGKTFYVALTLCVFPFVLFDVIKIVLALSISVIIRKAILKQSLNS